MFDTEFDGLAWITNVPSLGRNNFTSLSQSVTGLNLWWKSSPKIRYCVKYLQPMNVCFTLRVPNFYVQCDLAHWLNIFKQSLLITNLDGSMCDYCGENLFFIYMGLNYFLAVCYSEIWVIFGVTVMFTKVRILGSIFSAILLVWVCSIS